MVVAMFDGCSQVEGRDGPMLSAVAIIRVGYCLAAEDGREGTTSWPCCPLVIVIGYPRS